MADIRIEKKKPVWPWILLIVILAVVAFLYIYGSMDSEENDDKEPELEEVTYVKPQLDLHKNVKEIS
ncbi:hypothetical protein [Christiangramia sediminis]|uniref:Uncharacterized protein n=1 Tax=Christiangramia sediminis TaxID=2881336 RepID=A0A9X1RV88_9FLAO|nr:hypothetical protein [Christiangramia sediminis]MCB7480006.1 hypothetical protein [Christiangramia sediminis]